MPRTLNTKIDSVNGFVNTFVSLTIVFLVSVGYFGAITQLPMTI